MDSQGLGRIGTQQLAMGPELKKVGARGNMKGRIEAVSNPCLNFGDYSAN